MTVTISWYPSGRFPGTSRKRLIFAGANRASMLGVGMAQAPAVVGSGGRLSRDMPPQAEVIAVIAAYNEARAIEPVIRDLAPQVARGHRRRRRIRDATADVARRAGAVVLRHPINRGQGAALQSGITLALARGAAIVVTFDADGQHVAADVPKLVAPVASGAADVALGSRFLGGTSNVPAAAGACCSRAPCCSRGSTTGLELTDAHNGLRAFSRAAAQNDPHPAGPDGPRVRDRQRDPRATGSGSSRCRSPSSTPTTRARRDRARSERSGYSSISSSGKASR